MMRILFLPGAGGRRDFWEPVTELMVLREQALLVGWPGFGDEPPDSGVKALPDLVDYCLGFIAEPVDLVAQSMGGVVAMLLALRRPEMVRRLVLCGTSGGLDLTGFETKDWRPDYVRELAPTMPRWFVEDATDVEAQLGSLRQPTLLIWGEQDTIVPPAVGEHLARLLPDARLVKIAGATHAAPREKPDAMARYLSEFLFGVEVR